MTRRVVGLPARSTGRCPPAPGSGTLELRWRKRTIERMPVVTPVGGRRGVDLPACEGTSFQHAARWSSLAASHSLACSWSFSAAGRSGGGETEHRMIITVTLNAAIDKSLSVPNFRLGRRHRTVEQTHDAGRQGRQRRAHAQDARPARDRDRLRGRGDRHADRRAAHRGVDPQRLRAHPRGVAHQHRRPRPDQRRADRDQRARPGPSARGGRAVPRQAAVPGARRRDRRLRRLAAARGGARIYAELVRDLRADGRRPSSTPTASRCARPCAPSRT